VEARAERSVVASGKTVEDAIAHGLAMLGVRPEQVDIKIITEGSRGVLGFGAENARVQLAVKAPPVSAPEPISLAPEPPAAPVQEPEAGRGDTLPEQVGREVLTELLGKMGIPASVESYWDNEMADEDQPPPLVLNITGDDLGILIGRRGETLGALQYIVRLMVSHRLKHWSNLIVDVESYVVRRRHGLESLALRVAEQVSRTGRPQALEPMPPYERRVIHVALRKHPQVTTRSVGEGERRRVTIIPRK
jgi:spoIIIJ-associated protein